MPPSGGRPCLGHPASTHPRPALLAPQRGLPAPTPLPWSLQPRLLRTARGQGDAGRGSAAASGNNAAEEPAPSARRKGQHALSCSAPSLLPPSERQRRRRGAHLHLPGAPGAWKSLHGTLLPAPGGAEGRRGGGKQRSTSVKKSQVSSCNQQGEAPSCFGTCERFPQSSLCRNLPATLPCAHAHSCTHTRRARAHAHTHRRARQATLCPTLVSP